MGKPVEANLSVDELVCEIVIEDPHYVVLGLAQHAAKSCGDVPVEDRLRWLDCAYEIVDRYEEKMIRAELIARRERIIEQAREQTSFTSLMIDLITQSSLVGYIRKRILPL